MVGDDGQGLHRGLGELARLGALLGHQVLEVGGGLQAPAAGDLGQLHPAAGVAPLQGAERGVEVGIGGQAALQVVLAERSRGGEQQGLDHALGGGRVAHALLSRAAVSGGAHAAS